LRTSRTLWTLNSIGTSWTYRTLRTRCTVQAVCANWPGWAHQSLRTDWAGGASGARQSLRTDWAGGASGACQSLRTNRANGASGASQSLRTSGAGGTNEEGSVEGGTVREQEGQRVIGVHRHIHHAPGA
jgi:hypothetical protein